MELLKPQTTTMSELPRQQTIHACKQQQSKVFELPRMYESDHSSVSSADSREDGNIIPDPATLLNLKRSLAWSQDSEESINIDMNTDDADVVDVASFLSSWSTKIDMTNSMQQNDGKENGIRPVHWEQQVQNQQNLESIYRDFMQ
ncbi:unnamed protein product [Cylindrotheca closterium]|uniref:Uncharacterized protein n=1 Tax=Cylindrotheca closterium TaxID=2856 RepID=A0AAD2FKX8_9STRA|nr:unnamed protein product [Cylindrotheca closterium]